jgi:hypothetical protein
LLLVPFSVLVHKTNAVQKIILLFCYLAPTLALILYGRNGNISLIVVALAMFLLLYPRARNPVIDVPASAA